jgi:hypothetical protein
MRYENARIMLPLYILIFKSRMFVSQLWQASKQVWLECWRIRTALGACARCSISKGPNHPTFVSIEHFVFRQEFTFLVPINAQQMAQEPVISCSWDKLMCSGSGIWKLENVLWFGFFGLIMFWPSTFTAKGESCIVVSYVEDFQGPYYGLFKYLLYE